MTRVALYARYSSDNQREASIVDQFRLCDEYALREGWQLAGSNQDAAISGSSTILRHGIQQVVRDAQRGHFTVVIAEALYRISRDQADVATLYKHLTRWTQSAEGCQASRQLLIETTARSDLLALAVEACRKVIENLLSAFNGSNARRYH